MIVMGGIVGSGIFINPYVVAQQVHTPFLILGVWLVGGALAMLGAFIWAELATRLPGAGGQYLYLREAYHPAVAFVYGWVLLLVTQTGGMAAVAVTFARYYREISGVGWSDSAIAAVALLGLTAINCLGARAGSNVQSALMLMKTGAIAALVVAGAGARRRHDSSAAAARPAGIARPAGRHRRRHDPGGLRLRRLADRDLRRRRDARSAPRPFARPGAGVTGVVVLYLAVNFVCLKVLGPDGLAATRTPASAVMRAALGERGAWWIAVGIAISTLGFLSQGMLTAPRVYYAMARDGLFFERVGWLSPRTGAPVVAIVLQGVAATAIAFSGKYEQILNYEVSVDFISFALAGARAVRLPPRKDAAMRRADLSRAGTSVHHRALRRSPAPAIVASTVVTIPPNSARRLGHHADRRSRIFVLEPRARRT